MSGRVEADPLAPLRAEWLRLMREALPAAAAGHPEWPVRRDHCFGRVILDAVYARPWRAATAAPAWCSMDEAALRRAIALAEAILRGDADLAELNGRSLRVRQESAAVHRDAQVR